MEVLSLDLAQQRESAAFLDSWERQVVSLDRAYAELDGLLDEYFSALVAEAVSCAPGDSAEAVCAPHQRKQLHQVRMAS